MIRIKKMKVWTFITHSIRFYDFSVSLNPHNLFIYSEFLYLQSIQMFYHSVATIEAP